MDTATHISMGVALGGLATLDPVVQQDSTLFTCVMVGTIVGSNAPDFDTLLKLKNNAVYIRNHRGITHSIPAVIVWGVTIATVIHTFVPQVNFVHLYFWTFLAVILHVFVDIFNAYGTQAARPINRNWIALGFINTFDPYIFGLHAVGIVAWLLFGADPGITFLLLYFIIALYYVKRYFDKKEIVSKIEQHFDDVESIVTSPTIKHNVWRIAITTTENFYVARAEGGKIKILDQFKRKKLPDHPAMHKALQDDNVQAFIFFSPVYRWEIEESDNYTEVRFIDLRYRSKGHYPFVAVVKLDSDYHIRNSYTGWIYSEDKLQKKLDPLPQ
ncbi:metal-dependent hydrolase [Salinibacillus xinjiangensis]|uniref:Metal-dependent hydrolase n=1 Tax=Salinibacillus xinjiangensis TaxID=1229268 RepID=A0A6G1X9I3_9BACI|nr:metal-dependent hydrolase [Salinibacillus xinjiangensis]MRG87530.1 metal-dependent hydrolase [Salinibacillus xinjiangensis]